MWAFDSQEAEPVFSPGEREAPPSPRHAAERGIKHNGASPLSEETDVFL